MSFRQRYEPSSGSFGIRPIDLLFTRFAISRRQVYNSNGDKTFSPIAFFNAYLQLFTKASAHLLWCGANGVVNCHVVPLSAQYSRNFLKFHPRIISRNFHANVFPEGLPFSEFPLYVPHFCKMYITVLTFSPNYTPSNPVIPPNFGNGCSNTRVSL